MPQTIFWHRDLPPATARACGEHTVEADGARERGTLEHRDELWERWYQQLMTRARDRLAQEMARLGGDYAHVLTEAIDPRHDDSTGEVWLHGRFAYTLFRATGTGPTRSTPGAVNNE
jgi:hypothetical protein